MFNNIKNFLFDNPLIYNTWRSFVHKGFRVEKKIINSVVPLNSRVVDFGCGTGLFAKFVHASEYSGVDVPGDHLCYAKRVLGNDAFAEFDREFKVPLKSNYFDYVLCFHVVHHVPPEGLSRFREEILRLLKTKGSILIVDMFPVHLQKSIAGKLLVKVDRGTYQRVPAEVVNLFGSKVSVQKSYTVKIGPFRMYVLLMQKK